MIIGAAGVPRALGETRDYNEIFSQLAAAGIEAYFPTTQYSQIPQAQSLGFETDFLPPPHGTATPAVYEAMRAHGIKLAVNAEHLYDFSQPFPPLHEDPLVALIQAAGADLIYGVYAPDEPAFQNIDPAVSQLLYERVKTIAPSIPVLQVHRSIDEQDPAMQTPEGQAAYLAKVLEHAQWADMVGFDVYPIGLSIGAATPYSNGQIAAPAQAIRDYMTWLVENVPDKQHLMVLQGFSPTDLYSPEALAQLDPEAVAAARAPTAEEMRDMLAASEGAAAVWWWGQSHLANTNSQTWQDLVGETRDWVDTNGSAETTVIFGTASNDTLVGGVDPERLVGELGDDTLQGNGDDDVLVGGAGSDTMQGGAGNDTYYVDSAGDVVDETSGSGVDEVRTALQEYSLANAGVLGAVENLVGTSSAGQFLTGNDAANVITGSWGNDVLNGGAGADTLRGGGGDDAYIAQDIGDVVDETDGSGLDEIHTTLTSYSLQNVNIHGTVENLTGLAATGHNLSGNGLANVITGGVGNDTLDGAAGQDTLLGGVGNDIYIVDALDTIDESTGAGIDEVRTSDIYYTLAGAPVHGIVENLTGTAATAQYLVGNDAANTITSGTGDDVLDGGAGADVLRAGVGSDYYIVDNVGDSVTEAANEGTDTVQSNISFVLASNLENLLLAGTGSINGTGNSAANLIVGTSGNNALNGLAGDDILLGGEGSDTYTVDSASDLVMEESASPAEIDLVNAAIAYFLGDNVENLTLTGTSSIYGIGNELANRIVGNAGNNLIDGGAGIDTMTGAAGNDSYIVDNAADVIIEAAGQGTDDVNVSVSYILAAGVSAEALRTSAAWATTALNLTGNEQAQTLHGNAGANVLDGRAGADTMVGFAGNDVYVADNAADIIVEAAGQGTDSVNASVSYVLAAGVSAETLRTTSAAATTAINLTGNELVQTLQGNAGANVLDGRAGADTMVGFAGNDVYVADNAADIIVEAAGQGTDSVNASVSYVLAAGVSAETLRTTSAAATTAINLTGNELVQTLQGNAGANVLDGRAGADTMVGFAGNDVYVADNAADIIVEAAGQGTDSVNASVSYVLAAGVSAETLRTTSAAATTAINLTGNELVQTLQGNAGANVLDGRAGADTMVGFAGNDVYVADNAADIIVEAAGQGTDSVNASVSYVLAAGVSAETLRTTSAAATTAINLTGNELVQTLQGNAGANELSGGLGNDTLIGLGGNDKFVFNTTLGASNVDHITDFSVVNDAVVLDNLVFITLTTGTLAAGAFHIGAAAADADDRIIYNASNGALMYDSNGGIAGGSVQFAQLSTGLAMTNADFIVI